jgi:metal-dependent hydrolase (beta-lactamase superfamily II)
MSITIHTLVENSVNKLGPIAEYGLSFLITAGNDTILFDSGLGSALIPNAAQLRQTMEHLDQFQITRIAPCHCTGMQGQFALLQKFGRAYLQNSTGDRIDC